MQLAEYVRQHTTRGECKCGKCIDRGDKPDPTGHTVDMCFFVMSAINNPTIEEFTELTTKQAGEFCECSPFDGKEHSYLELGGWIGDQGLALQYMGLGVSLGLFNLLSPKTILGSTEDADIVMRLAGLGLITIQAKPDAAQSPIK